MCGIEFSNIFLHLKHLVDIRNRNEAMKLFYVEKEA